MSTHWPGLENKSVDLDKSLNRPPKRSVVRHPFEAGCLFLKLGSLQDCLKTTLRSQSSDKLQHIKNYNIKTAENNSVPDS